MRQVELLRDLSTAHFTSGDIIYRDGEPSDALYIILGIGDSNASLLQDSGSGEPAIEREGRMAAETQCEEDRQQARAFVPPGGIFGELGLIYRYYFFTSYYLRCTAAC